MSFRGTVPSVIRLVALCLLLLAGCSGIKVGRDSVPAPPGWIGQPVADFATRFPNAKAVYERNSLYVFEHVIGYGKCEIVLKTDGEVISEIVNLCPPDTLWLSPPRRRAP